MIRILGSNKRFCDGLTRRDLLHVGALAPLGLSLAGWSRAASPTTVSSASGFGTAKRCVLLYLWGSPSQIDTFDPKPDCAGGSPWRARLDPHRVTGNPRGRGVAAHCPDARPRHRAPLADASKSDPRDRVRILGGADDRPAARRQRARPAPLAVHRVGGRLPRRPRRLEAIGRAAKLLAAHSRSARSAARRGRGRTAGSSGRLTIRSGPSSAPRGRVR